MEQDPRFRSRDFQAVANRRAAHDANVVMLIRRLEELLAERKRLRPNVMPPDPAAQRAVRFAGSWPVGTADDTDNRLRVAPREC